VHVFLLVVQNLHHPNPTLAAQTQLGTCDSGQSGDLPRRFTVMTSVAFSGVSKLFGDTRAVDDLTLTIADGEFLVLLGPSGCGKSTVLRLLAGLETPDTGTIMIGDELVNDVDARHRDVAMVFQSYALYPHMTVAQNIESPLIGRRSERTSREGRNQQVAWAAELLGLTDLLNRKPGQLSGGQRQRVALARAIVRHPGIFLMDEPLSNLDAKLRAETRAELVDLHKGLAATIAYVTHDQVEAMTMATRIAVLHEGKLQQVADPRTLYDEPANSFVAQFIGSPPMNIIPGVFRAGDSAGAAVEIAGHRLGVAGAWDSLLDGQAVNLGIRPEDLSLANHGIPATVVIREWLGHEQILEVDLGGTRVALREIEGAFDTVRGSNVFLAADPSSLHLFDPDTGLRLSNLQRDAGPNDTAAQA